jgi:hypothetical protein
MPAFHKIIRFARKSPREQLRAAHRRLIDWGWEVPHRGNDRTTYVIGLCGTGRWYINDLITQNIGERAQYFRDGIRLHAGPTSMIYSGHATTKYVSGLQAPPAVTSAISKAIKLGFAVSIFVYRHPFDSLLTNWVWWRSGKDISGVYKNTDYLSADLDRRFLEFEAFARGDPELFAGAAGDPVYGKYRFLSFSEFVEEIELQLPLHSLTLRLEDFTIDPFKGLSEIAKVMSVDLDSNRLHVATPRTKPYRYLAVKEKVPRFKDFIDGLDAETKQRIKKIGYMDV